MKRKSKGFTLVELLVVVSIIALLIAILLPSLKKARDQTKKVKCAANLRSVNQAMLTYAMENNDHVPMHMGAEPNYVYVRGSSFGEFHLGELLMRQMGMDPIRRGTDGAPKERFSDEECQRTATAGEVFYCPATGNGKNLDPRFPTWGFPTSFGSFGDYAQFWNFIGRETRLINGEVVAILSGYVVMDDEQNQLKPVNPRLPVALYRLPENVSLRKHRSLPNSGPASEVPLFADYVTSFNRTKEQYKSEYPNNTIAPEGGNHRWTGHSSGSGKPVIGGNYGYVDGHVEWRSANTLKPRLIIDKQFTGGTNRPTYWW